jgi:Leucine-rich repeat (LRR) protein
MKVLRLTEISDVSGLQNLEEFSKNLLTIHESVGFLNKLKILNAEGCSKLRSFPPIKLTSLQQLRLSFCHRLKNFPEILGKMENIGSISLSETSIEKLPEAFPELFSLTRLNLDD